MYKNATKCNETIGKWCKTKHGASKIIDTFEMYQWVWLGIVPMEIPRLPRFRALHARGKTPTSCLLSISFTVVTMLLELFI
jgi:hypothetical protein